MLLLFFDKVIFIAPSEGYNKFLLSYVLKITHRDNGNKK